MVSTAVEAVAFTVHLVPVLASVVAEAVSTVQLAQLLVSAAVVIMVLWALTQAFTVQ
jgi:hypothetical protein